jgi:hypothetical protein
MSTQVAIVISVGIICITVFLTTVAIKGMDFALEEKELTTKS